MHGLCQFVKQNNERCRRSVVAGQTFCWQHARGLRAKWRSLPRSKAVAFSLSCLSLIATVGFGIWDIFLKPQPHPSPAVHIQSTGDNSPNIVDNQGSVTIQNSESTSQKAKGEQPEGKK
jgi:hypothetical protein